MQLSTRFGMVGIAGLGLLTTVHQLREAGKRASPAGDFLLGTLPNFAAAIAITFVLLSICADQNRNASYRSIKRWLAICASISGLGLLAWEGAQTMSDQFVFDLNDIAATILGIIASALLFHVVTRSVSRRS